MLPEKVMSEEEEEEEEEAEVGSSWLLVEKIEDSGCLWMNVGRSPKTRELGNGQWRMRHTMLSISTTKVVASQARVQSSIGN